MKTICFSVLLFVAISLKAQTFIVVEPMFFQLGVMQNVSINDKYGAYLCLRNGDVDQSQFHVDIIKYGIGCSKVLDKKTSLLVGLTYYQFMNEFDENPAIDLRHVSKLSFDIGILINPHKNVYFNALTDLINWETQIGIGYKF